MKKIYNYSNDEVCGEAPEFLPVISPLTNEAIAQVILSSASDVDWVVQNAKRAQAKWKNLTFKARAQYFYRYRELIIRDHQELVDIISQENGKLPHEAQAEVNKAIELTEFACSIPSLISGHTQLVSRGVEVKEVKEAKGVVASIMPFNFPLMVPHWTIPAAIVCGNAMIAKASEKTPLTMMKVASLLKEAGIPPGIFNIVNGTEVAVTSLCDHPDVDVITFVGSSRIAQLVYQRASMQLKPCLALGAAKNYIIVDNTVNFTRVAQEIVDAAFGMAGQRCMAASVVISVGPNNLIMEEVVKVAKQMQAGIDLPPVASLHQKDYIAQYLQEITKKGSKILLNGLDQVGMQTNADLQLNPTIIFHENSDNLADQEIFGPVLEFITVATLSDALALQNASSYGNGASIYTNSGAHSAIAQMQLQAGMIGINIGVPVPREPYGFGGQKHSRYGMGEITGPSSLNLFTQTKKITTKWDLNDRHDWMS